MFKLKGGTLLSVIVSDGSICIYNMIFESKVAEMEAFYKAGTFNHLSKAQFDNSSQSIRLLTFIPSTYPFIISLKNNEWMPNALIDSKEYIFFQFLCLFEKI